MHQKTNSIFTDFLVGAFKSSQCRTLDNRNLVAREIIFGKKFTNFKLDKLKKFFIIYLINLVQENNNCRNANLTSKKNVFTCLRHRAISSGNNKNCTVHLGSTGDHVLDIVSVSRAINVGVVTLLCLVFNVRCRNRDTTSTFFRRSINLVIRLELTKIFCNRCRQRCLTMVNVTNRADIYMRLRTFIFGLCHLSSLHFLPYSGLS
ncbi:unnamed protein product [Bartonella apihabitans]